MIQKLIFLYSYLKTMWLKKRFKSREELLAWQNRKLTSHVTWVRKNSKFYQKLWGSLDNSQWKEFPLIQKQIMMDHFSELNTVGIEKEKAFELALNCERTRKFSPTLNGVTVGLSSGTSGHRGLFLVSPAEQNLWAGSMLAKLLPNPLWKGARIAFFLRANSNLYQSVNKGKIKLNYFDMQLPISHHLAQLVPYNPTMIIAPPQVLLQIAQATIDGPLQWPALEKIVSAAETLDPLDEIQLEKAFHQKIHQGYQATEGFLGTTCSHGTLHLNEDSLVIEKHIVDPVSGKFMPIISDFGRRSQPVIRYLLNDILTPKRSPCPCGSVFQAIEQIEGRADDIFYFKLISENGGYVSIYPDFIRRAVLNADVPIKEYLVVQMNDMSVQVSLKWQAPSTPDSTGWNLGCQLIQENFERLAQAQNAISPHLLFTKDFPALEGKKLRRVVSHFKPTL